MPGWKRKLGDAILMVMYRMRWLVLVLVGGFTLPEVRLRATEPAPEAAEFFAKKVRPLLIERCLECHSEQKQKGGLNLSSRTGLLEGGARGAAVIPGKPDESLLIRAIHYKDKPRMPPKKKLPDQEIELLTRWVQMGLPWPEEGSQNSDTQSQQSPFTEEQRRFWAFQPVQS